MKELETYLTCEHKFLSREEDGTHQVHHNDLLCHTGRTQQQRVHLHCSPWILQS